MLAIGLMSGTSLDGIDAALVEFEDRTDGGASGGEVAGARSWTLRAFTMVPYTPEQRERIHRTIVAGDAADLCWLGAELGEWFADAVLRVCREAGVRSEEVSVIGSHGQTVWHIPPGQGRRGATLQLGCAATIAERTGIDVVSDFRARDMAAGGEGAPLVPWVDRELFSVPARRRVLLNVGGMANLTWLPRQGEMEPILAFDTGPGNALIDAAVALASGGAESYDRGGVRAGSGRVDDALLTELLASPYFERQPPKSTGREEFGTPYVEALAARVAPGSPGEWNDLIATLTALTARSVSDAIERWVLPRGVDEVIVTGGGAHNPTLLSLLADYLAPVPVLSGDALGMDPDAKEAVAFALLARAYLLGIPANVPEVTGAAGLRILGSFTPGRVRT